MRLLLTLNELALSPLSIGLSSGLFLILFFGCGSCFRLLVFLVTIFLVAVLGSRGKPLNEFCEECSHRILSLPVDQDGVFVHAQLLGVPLNEEAVIQHLIVVELLAQRGGELLHFRVGIDEELTHGLEEVLVAVILLLRHELGEHGLESVPVLHNVSVGAENAAHSNVHLVLTGHIELELQLAHLAKDVIGFTRASVSQLVIHEGLQLFTGTFYNMNKTC